MHFYTTVELVLVLNYTFLMVLSKSSLGLQSLAEIYGGCPTISTGEGKLSTTERRRRDVLERWGWERGVGWERGAGVERGPPTERRG
jgi:hypothetical protein